MDLGFLILKTRHPEILSRSTGQDLGRQLAWKVLSSVGSWGTVTVIG